MKSNRLTFGLGTIGRDMAYSLVSMFLVFYLTEIIKPETSVMWWVTAIMFVARVFDAANDPVMGVVVDNTRTRWGKFKPWIAFGAVTSAVFTVLFFVDFGLTGAGYIVVFALIYLLWGISFTTNDIAYWSMLPSLSVEQREREKIGSIARICANIGLFAVVAGIVPLTEMLEKQFGSPQNGWLVFALIVVTIMVAGQCVTLFGVKEPKTIVESKKRTPFKEILSIIFRNDQLTITAAAMTLFMIGYMTTTSFGLFFFKYAYGDENMYSVFAVILGVSQIAALAVFPIFSKMFERKTLYTFAIAIVSVGYIVFFFAPTDTMTFIGIAGVLLFVGQSFIQLMMLMFIADSVDYGQWKLGRRNDSVTFAIQPFINKLSGAVGTGIVSVVIILSGIKEAESAADVTPEGLLMMKMAMLILPLICIAVSYFLYRWKYKIDKEMYDNIINDLKERGEIVS
ncbi:MAG: glycoside-pentoside-hexuronide (GPH):cation symporter [Oscillospiraceae bacterium]|nr:glycoside-pentoside-hexuronide (GPH):cation symporter [Oscillospiraceae bacterium]